MYLHRRPFWWPCRCIEAIRSASSDAAWPGLHRKPLHAAIGWLLTPYCPSGSQGNNQQNNVKMHPLCWPFRWTLQCGGTIPPASHNGGDPWLHEKPLDTTVRQVFAPIASIGHAYPCFFVVYFIINTWKEPWSKRMVPTNNRGMTYQNDEKHLK